MKHSLRPSALEHAVARGEAGADGIFPEAANDLRAHRRFVDDTTRVRPRHAGLC
jgi:2-methylisocitrate lyase-like PEP mutase family enzyme